MILRLDLAASRPLFVQIGDEIKRSLVSGELSAGDALPPGRELAASLEVSLETVQRAYRELALEGIVTSRVGRGTRVADPVDLGQLGLESLITDLIERAQSAGVSRPRLIELVERAYS